MRYLHTMVRISDIDESLKFYCDILGLKEVHRYESEKGRFTNIFLYAPGDEATAASDKRAPVVELTYNWDPEEYKTGPGGISPSVSRISTSFARRSWMRVSPSTVRRVTVTWRS